jgi:hypothetical protein
MKNKITVRRYQKSDFTQWNSFINEAKNSTFLFHRDFMEYHSDRFEDFSLLIFEKETLLAVLPANRVESTVISHQGLTYGGLVLGNKTLLANTIFIMQKVLEFLNESQIQTLHLKIIPSIYNTIPSDEMEYISFLVKANLVRKDSLAVVDTTCLIPISRVRKRGVEKGNSLGLIVKEETDLTSFWNQLLVPNLASRYQTKPVHSLDEITYLKSKFTNNIKQFNVFFENKLIGGVTVFFTKNVIHPQYISGNKEFNNIYGGLDFLYNFLLTKLNTEARFFDFGPSNESNGLQLNESLHYWKESFGARTIVQNFYEIETKNYSLLEHVLV